jgi:conjugal transfer mating pair stabilization protein TraN
MQHIVIMFMIFSVYSNGVYAFEEEKCKSLTEKVCIDFSEKNVDGFAVSKCWKYEQKFKCIGKEQNNCATFEENRGCNEVSGKCLEDTDLGICKHFEKKYVCGAKLEEQGETKLFDAQFTVLKDEKDLSLCSESEKNKYCNIEEETCVEGAETRNINGKDVHKDCWKWDRKYVCRTDTYVDECKELKEKCKEISKECLHEEEGRCEHFVIKYNCTEETANQVDCIASKFCVGGICDTKQRSKHNDFGQAISSLNILSQMKSNELEGCKCPDGKKDCQSTEIDPKSCKFFTGGSKECRKYTGEFNCCGMGGFLRGIFKCNQNEKDLYEKRRARFCHYVGTRKGKGKIDRLYKRWESYCCYNSKLSRIIQEAGHSQLGISWGSAENPNCRALTLDEIQRMDFSKINFSEVFDEVRGKAESIANSKKEELKSKAQSYKSNPSEMSELLNKKIRKFYGDAGK